MKYSKKASWCLMVIAAAVGLWCLGIGLSWADDLQLEQPNLTEKSVQYVEQGQPPLGRRSEAQWSLDRVPVDVDLSNPLAGRQFVFQIAGPNDATSAIRKAAEALRDAADEDAKSKATEQLTDLLDKYFDEDMHRREEELAKIEERVRKLHETLERRKAKRREIIDLQIKVLVNEANGLGFFSEAQPSDPLLRTALPRVKSGGGGGGSSGRTRVESSRGETVVLPPTDSSFQPANESRKTTTERSRSSLPAAEGESPRPSSQVPR